MKIAICDDDQQELFYIKQLVDDYLRIACQEEKTEVSCFVDSSELLLMIQNGQHFDVFLLDVIMPGINGIELATEVRIRDHVAKIIFLTSSAEYAVDSYTVDAFNYLLKPVQKDKFFTIFERACATISNITNDYIIVKNHICLSKVFLYKLIYAEVINRKIYFHQTDEPVLESNGVFSDIEAILLKDKRFIKPHRSYIINLDYIRELSPETLTTTCGTIIPVSRKVFKQVKQAYMAYSFDTTT